MSKLFVDNHCHLFNVVDIPLYKTLIGKVEMGTLKKLVTAIGAAGVILLGRADDILESQEEFIRFFERSIEKNLVWLSDQVVNAVNAADTQILMTPLVMDFDRLHETDDASLPDTKLREQIARLKAAIEDTADQCQGVKYCPFIGYDLRKLENDGGLANIQALWEEFGIPGSDRAQETLEPGKVLGIKLYPPIGFNPYPENDDHIIKYNQFYTWCALNDIPITTHCQNASGSYSSGLKRKEVNRLTHAKNWWRLFEDFPQIRGLHINFAHFGGEDGLDDMIDKTIDEKSWSYYLVRLLKKYPNTYADLSAYDFADKESCENLKKTLLWDEQGKFYKDGDYGADGEYKLKDKLLWGSDVPMVISSDSYFETGQGKGTAEYRHLYNRFTKLVDVHQNFTETNSKAFSMIGDA